MKYDLACKRFSIERKVVLKAKSVVFYQFMIFKGLLVRDFLGARILWSEDQKVKELRVQGLWIEG